MLPNLIKTATLITRKAISQCAQMTEVMTGAGTQVPSRGFVLAVTHCHVSRVATLSTLLTGYFKLSIKWKPLKKLKCTLFCHMLYILFLKYFLSEIYWITCIYMQWYWTGFTFLLCFTMFSLRRTCPSEIFFLIAGYYFCKTFSWWSEQRIFMWSSFRYKGRGARLCAALSWILCNLLSSDFEHQTFVPH